MTERETPVDFTAAETISGSGQITTVRGFYTQDEPTLVQMIEICADIALNESMKAPNSIDHEWDRGYRAGAAACWSKIKALLPSREYKIYEGQEVPDGFTWSLRDEIDRNGV